MNKLFTGYVVCTLVTGLYQHCNNVNLTIDINRMKYTIDAIKREHLLLQKAYDTKGIELHSLKVKHNEPITSEDGAEEDARNIRMARNYTPPYPSWRFRPIFQI